MSRRGRSAGRGLRHSHRRTLRQVTVAESTVELASGLRLSCASAGPPDGPALVMVPGPTDSWRSFEPVLQALPNRVHAIAVSCRGHGDSDKPPSGYTVGDLATDTVELLDALQIERAVLAGHSGSCMTVRRAAIRHPERVAGLVLEASPSTLVGHAALESILASVIDGLGDPIDRELASSWIEDTSIPALAPELREVLIGEVLKVPAHVWREMFHALATYDDRVELARVTAPALLVWGDRDELVTRDAQDALVQLLPRASLSVYAGVGHAPRWEEPERYAREAASFVATCFAPDS